MVNERGGKEIDERRLAHCVASGVLVFAFSKSVYMLNHLTGSAFYNI